MAMVLGIGFQDIGQFIQDGRAFRDRGPAPGFEGFVGCRDGPIHIIGAGLGYLSHHFSGCWVFDLQIFSRSGYPLSVDIEFILVFYVTFIVFFVFC